MYRSKAAGKSLRGALIVWLLAGTVALGCGKGFALPKDRLSGVNEYGFVSYWEQIGEIALTDGTILPINIGFQSDRDVISPYLGSGWILPLLESRIVQLDEGSFRLLQIDGYTGTYRREAIPLIIKEQATYRLEKSSR